MERALPAHTLRLTYETDDGRTVTNEVTIPAALLPFGQPTDDLFGALLDADRRRDWLVRMGLSLGYGIADRLDRPGAE